MWWLRGVFLCELKDGYTPAHYAALYDATGEKLKLILAACPACIDVQSNLGRTALHRAAQRGNEKNIQVLISAGCNPLLKKKNGETAYDVAIREGNTAAAKLLEEG